MYLKEKGPLINYSEHVGYRPTHICTGFGSGVKGVPQRVVAYALPLWQAAAEYDITPEGYVSTQFGPILNSGTHLAQYTNSAKQMKEYLSAFEECFQLPRINWLEEQDPNIDFRMSEINTMADTLQLHAHNDVRKFAQDRSGHDSFRYIAAHALYMWDPNDALVQNNQLALTSRLVPPKRLMMIGGPAEKTIYSARQTLLDLNDTELHPNRWESKQAFSDIGRRMAYVQQFNEPIIGERSTLLDSLSGKSGTVYQSDISTDMWMLLIACSQTLGIKTPAATPNMKKESKRIAEQFSLGRLDTPCATDIKDTAERIDAFANRHIVNRHF